MNILNLHLVPNIACEEENKSKPFIITKRKNVEASIVANCLFLGLVMVGIFTYSLGYKSLKKLFHYEFELIM